MDVDDLKKLFNVSNDADLGAVFGRTNKAVSKWRSLGEVPAAIEKRARELTKDEPKTEGFTLIPLYDVAASAGGGALVEDEAIVDRLAFKEEWIKHVLRVNPKDLALISTVGDSMEPTLHAGDIIMLDRSVTSIINNAIYVIQVDGTLMVKRVQRMIDGRVIIKSDNSTYEVETVPGGNGKLLADRREGSMGWKAILTLVFFAVGTGTAGANIFDQFDDKKTSKPEEYVKPWWTIGPKTFDECLLKYMKLAQSDTAAHVLRVACAKEYSAGREYDTSSERNYRRCVREEIPKTQTGVAARAAANACRNAAGGQ